MTNTTRRRAMRAALVVAVLRWTSGAAAMESGQPTAVVRVDNEAAVSASELRFAEARAGEVFRRIGIRVTWVDNETAMRQDLHAPYTVIVTNSAWRDEHRQQRLTDDTLGVAIPVEHRAHVYYDRIVTMQIEIQRSTRSILGDVIAHELGHLLLAPPSHSANGIMRPNVSFSWSIETFTDAEARQIRARLRQAP